MTKVNEILFDTDNYLDGETIMLEEAREAMLEDIYDLIKICVNNGYAAVIKPFEKDIVAVQFEKDSALSNSPMWLTQEEKNKLIKMRIDRDEWSLKLP